MRRRAKEGTQAEGKAQRKVGGVQKNRRVSSSFLSMMVSEIVCGDMRVTERVGVVGVRV